MRMQKGICIELNENRSVFMLPDGVFVHGSPVNEAVVGEEVYFYPTTSKSTRRIQWRPVWAPFIAALAVAALFFTALFPSQETFAYVQVQINPGIELGINEEYQVVSVRKLNEDGDLLIEQLGKWKEEPLEEILNRMMKLCINDSIKEVIITTVDDNSRNETEEEIEKMVLAVPDAILRKDIDIKLKEATKEQRQQSLKESIPVGQLVEQSTEIEKEVDKEKERAPIKLPSKVEPEKVTPQKEEVERKAEPPSKKEQAPQRDKAKKEPRGQEKKEQTKQKKEHKNTVKKENKEQKAEQDKQKRKDKKTEHQKEKSDGNPKNNSKTESDRKHNGNSKAGGKSTAPGQQKKQENNGKKKEKSKQRDHKKEHQAPGQEKAKKKPPGQDKKKESQGKGRNKHDPGKRE